MAEIPATSRSGAVRAEQSGAYAPESHGLDERPLPELLRQLSDQSATLVRQEIELAKAELTQKGKRLGVGAGALGGAGVLGLYALGALTAFFILALDIVVATWLAALITAAFWALVAGVLAVVGRGQVKRGGPPVPERATASVKQDVESVKANAEAGRR